MGVSAHPPPTTGARTEEHRHASSSVHRRRARRRARLRRRPGRGRAARLGGHRHRVAVRPARRPRPHRRRLGRRDPHARRLRAGSLAGPLDLPAGTHTVAITAADAADATSPAIGPVDLALDAGGRYTAVAHLDAGGAPTATLFTDDTSAVPAGQGRLTVRHVAAAPAVDVLAAGSPVITGLANPDEQTITVPAGTVPVAVAAAGTTEPVLGPTDLDVAEGVGTIVYAWGSLEGGTLQLAVQTIDGTHSAPGGVPSGELGLTAADGPSPAVLWFGGAALVAALGAVLLATRRPAGQRR